MKSPAPDMLTLFDLEPSQVLPHGRHAKRNASAPSVPLDSAPLALFGTQAPALTTAATTPSSATGAPAAAAPTRTRIRTHASSGMLTVTTRPRATSAPDASLALVPAPVVVETPPRRSAHSGPVGPRWAHRLAVFDLETTGIDVETSRVVTANVSIIDHTGATESRLDWIANPGVPIPAGAAAIHGVSTERAVAEGRYAPDVIAEIVDALTDALDQGLSVVIYNAPYDLTLLHREALRHGITPLREPIPVVDPLVIDKALDRYRRGKRTLEAAAFHYEVELLDAHDAAADAIAAGRVAQALALRYEDLLDLSQHDLHHSQVQWSREQSASFEEYMLRKDPTFTPRRSFWPIG